MGNAQRALLADRLIFKTAEIQRDLPELYYRTLRKSVAYLRDSGLFDGALAVGDSLPPFRLQNADGQLVDSADLLGKGPLVVSFFRGDWCRFCSQTLVALAEIDENLRALGATQVSITPDLPEMTAQTVRKLSLPFDVLSDIKSAFGLKCGISYRMPDDLVETYHAVNLINRHGSADFFLPIPAVFITDRQGIVRLSFVDPDYERRLEPQAILDMLSRLS